MPTITTDETTRRTTVEFTASEVINALRPLVEAAGGTWPDFGAGEGDHTYLRLEDVDGGVAHLGQTTAAVQTLILTDQEPV